MDNNVAVLQDLIDESGLSLRQLAKAIGIDSSQLSRYLKGYTMRIDTALKIAKYFDCSLDYLFGLDHHQNTVKYQTDHYDLSGFVARYQQLLVRNRISGRQFTKQNNLNKSIASHWKAGMKPKLDVLYLIAKELGGSIDELIGRS